MSNNKIFKKIVLILLVFLSSFSFLNFVNAANGTSGKWHLTNADQVYYAKSMGKEKRYVGSMGIYSYKGNHVYCIEPGDPLSYDNDGYNTKNDSNYSKLTSSQITNIRYILTFAEHVADISKSTETQAYKVAAAQGLIWEIVTGERTNFSSLSPNNKPEGGNGFYTVISNNTSLSAIKTEYDRIVKAIQNTFLNSPGSDNKKFNAPGSEKIAQMIWEKDKYVLKISDAKFSYWQVSNAGGLKASINKNTLTITSTSAIDYNDAKAVKIKIYNKNSGSAAIYYSSKYQDVISVTGTTLERSIKVYTPKYQLKIIKKASLDGKVLKGAKFNICSNSTCTKVLKTVETDAKGEATFQNIQYPGTYYIKEISAPAGYNKNTKISSVKVTSSNLAGSKSFANITIKNENKQFNLTKRTVDEKGKVIDLNDGCGTNNYTGPEFEIKENGNSLYFVEIEPGKYDVSAKNIESATTKLKTCNGKFRVYTLPKCNYTITETKAPEGLTLPSEPSKSINVCSSGKNVSFTNGFAGLEFQKKDENGNFIEGGKFSLQKKENNIYKDVLLKKQEDGNYIYDSSLTEKDKDATYIILTNIGIARISQLPPGEYRIAEKEAPEDYELIQDKDSTSLVTIKDSDKAGYYLVEMINQKVNKNGSESSAELVVTITTGRKVLNYVLIISFLSVILIIAIILRKKVKK